MSLNSITPEILDRLEAASPGVISRMIEPRYLEEPRGRHTGQAAAVARPRSTQQVAALLRVATAERIPVIPYAGGTGLVAGQVAPNELVPLLISLERMSAVRHVDPIGQVIEVEAGAILADVQSAAAARDMMFPLSLASEGSARMGGLLGTNAGGVNVLRYGNARDLTLGIEAVLADGTIISGLKRLRKDNTGYDIRHLMIGSEGTLGIITAATLRLFPAPGDIASALIAVPDPAAALRLFNWMQHRAGAALTAFEIISGNGPQFLSECFSDFRHPLQGDPDWMVLLDLSHPLSGAASAQLEALAGAAFEDGMALDAILSQNGAQRDHLWSMRERIPDANRMIGAIASHDISLPISILPDFIAEAAQRIAQVDPSVRINCFGHMGDGNLHYNVYPPTGVTRDVYDLVRADISRVVHDLTHEMQGSISAEHGIGRLKTAELIRYGDPGKVQAMRAVKAALDPRGILNPGAVLSPSTN